MMTPTIRNRTRKREHERGAALVELAVVAPLLITFALGVFEIVTAWGHSQTVVEAARGAARTTTQTGQAEQADQLALRSIKATFDSNWVDVQRVVVYEATSPDGSPPVGCVAAGVTSSPGGLNCNVYVNADLGDVLNDARFYNGPDCGGGKSSNWCPTLRDNELDGAQWVGVWVEFEQPWLTGMFALGNYTITENTVMRMEPRPG